MPEERRRRMSRHIRLVLVGGLPGLFGCGGCGGTSTPPPAPAPEPMEEVEEIDEDPPPDGPAHLAGAPFIGWWVATHPPIVTYRMVPRAAVLGGGGYTRTPGGYYRRHYYGGRSAYLYGGSAGVFGRPSGVRSPSSRPSSSRSSGVVRGGFGSSGHAAAGG